MAYLHKARVTKARSARPEGSDPCGPDPYEVIIDRCKFADTQSLKLQESPDSIPTGEMPRHILLTCDRVRTNSRLSTIPSSSTAFVRSRCAGNTRNCSGHLYDHAESYREGTPPFWRLFSVLVQQKQNGVVSIRSSYIRVMGLQVDSDVRCQQIGFYVTGIREQEAM